jgi:hypothetical protein
VKLPARAPSVIGLLATLAAALCLSLAVLLAVVAYRGSKETGGGAAQGDLGFFMILMPATVGIVGVTLLSSWTERRFAERRNSPALWLYVASWCAVAWDWFFLWFVWRA